MKLIEAFIVAHQEYGNYGDWKAIHADGCFIGRRPRLIRQHGTVHPVRHQSDMYSAYGIEEGDLISKSDRLETVLSDFAERYPYQVLDERWKVSRWE
jgi:hypothetical protein